MTLTEFIEKADGAPWELERVAELATEVTNVPELREAAQEFLAWRQEFLDQLEAFEVELG